MNTFIAMNRFKIAIGRKRTLKTFGETGKRI